jgi:uncharacterized protein (DUF1778 family)
MHYMSEKTATLNFRVPPYLKAALERAAAADNRSLTGLVEKLIIDHCKKHGFLKERP